MLAQTPAITSVQSGTPSSTSPNHGNAVTAGAPYGYIYLYLNGSFDPQLFSHVEWKNTTTGELELIECNYYNCSNLFVTPSQVIVRIPCELFREAASRVTVEIRVVEAFDANQSKSNIAQFFINPNPGQIYTLPKGIVGRPYSQSLVTGGTPPFATEAFNPSLLPPGLNVTAATATLEGTPTTIGRYDFYLEGEDSWGVSFDGEYTVLVVPPPVVTSMDPVSRLAGSGDFVLTVTGTGFDQEGDVGTSKIYFGQTGLTTVVPRRRDAPRPRYPARWVLTPGNVGVFVRNLGDIDSNVLNFQVTAPPTTFTLNPTFAIAGGAAFNLVVTGTNFLNPTTVRWNGSPLSTTYNSTTQVTAAVPANLIATAGTANITLSNTYGVTGPVPFTIRGLLNITTASLPQGTAGSNYTFAMSATGGSGTYTWSATGLPQGFSINANTGVISGNTQAGDTYTVTVTVRDSQTQVTARTYSLLIVVTYPPLNVLGSLPERNGWGFVRRRSLGRGWNGAGILFLGLGRESAARPLDERPGASYGNAHYGRDIPLRSPAQRFHRRRHYARLQRGYRARADCRHGRGRRCPARHAAQPDLHGDGRRPAVHVRRERVDSFGHAFLRQHAFRNSEFPRHIRIHGGRDR